LTPQDHPLDRLLRELTLHSALGDEDRQAILDLPVRIRRLDPLAYLVRDGVLPVICSVLIDGFAFRQKVTGSGSRQILALCFPGDAVDLQNIFLNVADHSVQMLTSGTVANIKREDIRELVMTRPFVGAALIKLTLIEASIMREWVVNVGRRHARERIAHLLCEFAVTAETRGLSTGGYDLPMTQEQLADATGLTPVHVNRILKGLETEGLIVRQRRHIHFPSWRALQQVGDFNWEYLHLANEQRNAIQAVA
jgi:CRP-like cAMP-binding protein